MRREESFCKHCGAVEERKKRSVPHHKFFFQAISASFENWPHEHRFLPQNPEHLRAWLLVQAGHCNIIGQTLTEETDVFRTVDLVERVLTAIRGHGGYGFPEVSGHRGVVVRFAKSINWREVSQKDFQPIANAVFEIIENEIGVPVDKLVREAEYAI